MVWSVSHEMSHSRIPVGVTRVDSEQSEDMGVGCVLRAHNIVSRARGA